MAIARKTVIDPGFDPNDITVTGQPQPPPPPPVPAPPEPLIAPTEIAQMVREYAATNPEPTPEPAPEAPPGEIVVTAPKGPPPPPAPKPPPPSVSSEKPPMPVEDPPGEIIVTGTPPEDPPPAPLSKLAVAPAGVPLDNPVPEQPEPAAPMHVPANTGVGSPAGSGAGGSLSKTAGGGDASQFTPLIEAMMQGPGPISPIALARQGGQQPMQPMGTDPRIVQAMLQRSFFNR